MGYIVHRLGNQYRLWATEIDSYVTPPTTCKEVEQYLLDRAIERARDSIQETMDRARDKGSSSRFDRREHATTWEQEICPKGCGYHHAFVLRPSDGKCANCGEPQDHRAHGPECNPPKF